MNGYLGFLSYRKIFLFVSLPCLFHFFVFCVFLFVSLFVFVLSPFSVSFICFFLIHLFVCLFVFVLYLFFVSFILFVCLFVFILYPLFVSLICFFIYLFFYLFVCFFVSVSSCVGLLVLLAGSKARKYKGKCIDGFLDGWMSASVHAMNMHV